MAKTVKIAATRTTKTTNPLSHKAKGIVKKSHTKSPKPKAAPNTTKVAVKTVRKVERKAVVHKTVAHKSKLVKSVAAVKNPSSHALLVLVGQSVRR
ncbi:hypothetical protein HDU98_000548 [Podochytrium sp. JEL0797]|nr:hypothetical protein HDU98_000548 [Podochytrium sp. JEL0797]